MDWRVASDLASQFEIAFASSVITLIPWTMREDVSRISRSGGIGTRTERISCWDAFKMPAVDFAVFNCDCRRVGERQQAEIHAQSDSSPPSRSVWPYPERSYH